MQIGAGKMKTVGILSLQGAVEEHQQAFAKAGVRAVAVKRQAELDRIDALVLPGGESTAMGHLLNIFGLLEPVRRILEQGLPVWGTCAGMILLAKKIENQEERYFSLMDIEVCRNGYGGQLQSFCTTAVMKEAGSIPMVFIRAPYIARAEKTVEILAEVDGKIVAARQKNMLVTSFHPELTADQSVQKYFAGKFLQGM